MNFDIQNQLCAAQSFTGAATVSENAYEKGTAAQDISIGRPLSLLCRVTTAAGAGSTHTMDLLQADNDALTSNPVVLATKSILAAALTVGTIFEIPIPQGVMTKKYIGFQNTATGGATTVSLDVYIVPSDGVPHFKTFPKAVNAAV